MKVLLIADIHGNHEALQAILDSGSTFDRILCQGDVVGYYSQVNDVIETLIEVGACCIRGNHDQMVMDGGYSGSSEAVRFGLEVARDTLKPANRAWLEERPLSLGLDLAGRSLLMVHASPWDPLPEYIYPDSEKLPLMEEFRYDVVAYGHTHKESLIQTKEGRWLVNPGSVGQSRTKRGTAMGATLCTETMQVELLEVAYDAAPLVCACEELGAGDWVRTSLGFSG